MPDACQLDLAGRCSPWCKSQQSKHILELQVQGALAFWEGAAGGRCLRPPLAVDG